MSYLDIILNILVLITIRFAYTSVMLGYVSAIENSYKAYLIENNRIHEVVGFKDIDVNYFAYAFCIWKWTTKSAIKEKYRKELFSDWSGVNGTVR